MTVHDPVPNMPRFTGTERRCANTPENRLTQAEYRDMVKGMDGVNDITEALRTIITARDKMPEKWRDELNGRLRNFFLIDIDQNDVNAAVELSDEMEAGLDERGRFS